MDPKTIRKSIGRFLGWFLLILCLGIVKILPARFLFAFARGMSFLGYRLAGKQRKIAFESLSIAFGDEKSPQQMRQIAKRCFTNLLKSAVELLFLMDRPHLLSERVRLVHKEYLERALRGGHGVILVSAHFGNFPLMLARIALEGHATAGIMRRMRDSRVERIFYEKRRSLHINTIYSQPRNECVSKTIEALRKNEVVFIPIDQNFGTGGIFVDFFGRKAATATGPVILAQRTEAQLLPCFIIRQADDTHRIVFEEPFTLRQGSTSQETIRINIQKLTSIIERYIRAYPEEWGWIHRRWKSKSRETA